MDPAVITLAVLAVVSFLFITEIIPMAVTAVSAAVTLGLCGVLTSKEVFSGFSNSTVVLYWRHVRGGSGHDGNGTGPDRRSLRN